MNKSQSTNLPQEKMDIPELGTLAPVAQPIPGYLKNNPDCICGWKMKRIYASVQVKSSGSRKYRNRSRN